MKNASRFEGTKSRANEMLTHGLYCARSYSAEVVEVRSVALALGALGRKKKDCQRVRVQMRKVERQRDSEGDLRSTSTPLLPNIKTP